MSIPAWKHKSLQAVAEKRLPIRPGDYIFFNYKNRATNSRLFVVSVSQCQPIDNQARGEPTMGQWVGGIAWDPKGGQRLGEFWLDWSSFEDNWSIIQRL